MTSKTNLEVVCLLHAIEDLMAHHALPTIHTTYGSSVPHHRQVHPMIWDADTFTELTMEPDLTPDLLVRLLVAATIQLSAQASIGFESQEDRAHPVIRYHGHVRMLTATEASRQLPTLLDSTEAGDIVMVTRGDRPIAEIRPMTRRTGQDPRTALEEISPPDEKFIADVAGAVNFTTHIRTGPREGAQF